MEEKILDELKEIKELLHDIKENMEQKEIKVSLESSDSNTNNLI
ncbi:hypothetical protein [Parvimonas micra]|nr:hypothetical protein [Parvimonas micra]